MIFFDKTRTIGQDANGKNVVWVSIYVDTAANLPAYNDYQSDGFILCMSSEGRCIDTGDLYRLDSAGAWQISQAGTGTYTKAEIDTLLNAKQDVLTFDSTPTQGSTNPVTSGGVWTDQQRQDALQTEDRDAIVELIDSGDKNKITFKSLRRTASNYGTSVYTEGVMFTLNADGTVTVNREVPSSSNAYVTLCTDSNVAWSADDFCTGGYVLSGCPSGGALNTYMLVAAKGSYAVYDAGNGVVLPSTSETGIGINIIIYGGYNVQNLTFRPMICTSAAWKISQAYQPYRPSWQEMYDMILALQ